MELANIQLWSVDFILRYSCNSCVCCRVMEVERALGNVDAIKDTEDQSAILALMVILSWRKTILMWNAKVYELLVGFYLFLD